jgi:hypothetical protein
MSILAVLVLSPLALSGGTKSPLGKAELGDHIAGPKIKPRDLKGKVVFFEYWGSS